MILTAILSIVGMLLLSAFFSGMEIAFTSSNRLRLEIDRKQSRVFDAIAGLFARHPGQYITTILVGNNIALVVYSLSMSLLMRQLLPFEPGSDGSLIFETAVSTIIIIFVAEFLPKSVFRTRPNFYFRTLAPVIYFFYLLLYPLARVVTWLAQAILRIFGLRTGGTVVSHGFDRNDLETLLDTELPDTQSNTDNEVRIFQNVLDFADQRVRDCMVPRVEMEAVPRTASIEELTARFVESQFSRIFVYDGSIDHIVGYVNSKSLFLSPHTIDEVVIPVQEVPETMLLQTLLQTLIRNKTNTAVVLDEFGGTAGLVSLEDVLEQIFGEIEDEHDRPELVEKQVGEDEYILSCRLEVEDLNEKYGLGIPLSDEYDTLAGYIISLYGSLPPLTETLHADGLEINVLRRTRSRLEVARVKKL